VKLRFSELPILWNEMVNSIMQGFLKSVLNQYLAPIIRIEVTDSGKKKGLVILTILFV
jgi:hypothetical protein